jgi:hypothetical protein
MSKASYISAPAITTTKEATAKPMMYFRDTLSVYTWGFVRWIEPFSSCLLDQLEYRAKDRQFIAFAVTRNKPMVSDSCWIAEPTLPSALRKDGLCARLLLQKGNEEVPELFNTWFCKDRRFTISTYRLTRNCPSWGRSGH